MRQPIIVLRTENSIEDNRFLSVELKNNGDLVIHGIDSGSGVKKIFDFYEYEWYWTIKQSDVHLIHEVLGNPDSDTLSVMKENFSDDNAANLHQFLTENSIPFESWSRTGD